MWLFRPMLFMMCVSCLMCVFCSNTSLTMTTEWFPARPHWWSRIAPTALPRPSSKAFALTRICTAVLTRSWPRDIRSIPPNSLHQHLTALSLNLTKVYLTLNIWTVLDEAATSGGEIAAKFCSPLWAASELPVESTASKMPWPRNLAFALITKQAVCSWIVFTRLP